VKQFLIGVLVVVLLVAALLIVRPGQAQAAEFRTLSKDSGYGIAKTTAWTKNYRYVYFGAVSKGNFISMGWAVECTNGFHKAGGKTDTGMVVKRVRIPYGQGRCVEAINARTPSDNWITAVIAVRG
jgi:hypothetical protein